MSTSKHKLHKLVSTSKHKLHKLVSTSYTSWCLQVNTSYTSYTSWCLQVNTSYTSYTSWCLQVNTSYTSWYLEREREMFYLTTHSTHFIYGYMASDILLRTILIVRKETRCRHIGYSFRLTARVLLYAPSHRQDNTYHSLCYTSRGALAGTKNSSMDAHPMKDQSDNPSHHERMLYLWATSCSPGVYK